MKYFATLGPMFNSVQDLVDAIELGLNGVRINLSHGDLIDSVSWLENIQKAKDITKKEFEIILDIKGSEQRIKASGELKLLKDDKLRIYDKAIYDKSVRGVYADSCIIDQVDVGDELFIDDGKVLLQVIEKLEKSIVVESKNDCMIYDNKSISVKNKTIVLPSVSENDIKNFEFSKKFDIKGFMLPFVRSKADIINLKEKLNSSNINNYIIYSKIEDTIGVENIDEIMEDSDVIVIARGDLGNNIGLLEVPKIQKLISEKCRKNNKDFLVVTQLLNSMIDSPNPTRAEINDIYNSTLDGASSLMITGESAIGKYPLQAIKYLILASKI